MKTALDHPTAVDLLRNPKTWNKGARTLAALGNPRALLDLMRAYELRVETSRLPLLDAMDSLGAALEATRLYETAADDEDRRMVVHLMELFPSSGHLAVLAHAAQGGSPPLRWQAARSLICQPRSAEWKTVEEGLLDSPDERVREWAAEGLRLDK